MSCLKPYIRAETWDRYKTKEGKTAFKADIFGYSPEEIKAFKKLEKAGRYKKIDMIPCGQCIECRLQKSRDWGTRGTLEKLYHTNETAFFVTFTYANEYLPTHTTVNVETGEKFEGISINNEDMQKFWKRLRKKYPNAKIKYLAAGEYGGQTMRPHYHAIIYDLPLDITTFKKIGLSELNQPEWQSPELDEIWGMGHVTVGSATFESIAYVARYTLKKTIKDYSDWFYESQGLQKEWLHMSNGIGMQYYEDNRDKIYKTDSVPISNKKTGQLVKPPKAYDRKYKEYDPEHFSYITKKRKEAGEANEYFMLTGTDMPYWEKQKKDIERMEQVIKDLRKDIV